MPGDNYRTDGKQMIRTGAQHRVSIRDDRQVWINGERVKDVTLPAAPSLLLRKGL
jgi:hypothetical protein